jgi:hypothetical protein
MVRRYDDAVVIWWDWKTSQRLALVGAMLGVAALPFILIGVFAKDWRGFAGGPFFLFIPQLLGWMLYVGLRTGRLPTGHGRSESRSETPIWFWVTAGAYAALMLLILWFVLGVVILGF